MKKTLKNYQDNFFKLLITYFYKDSILQSAHFIGKEAKKIKHTKTKQRNNKEK